MLTAVQYALSNGPRMAVAPGAGHSTISLWAGYDCGSRHDPPGMGGLAHLIEHLCSGLAASDYAEFGAQFNAHTHLDFTCYNASFLPEYLARALDAERLRMTIGVGTGADLDREINGVSAELRTTTCRPEWGLSARVVRACFGTHPYGRPVAGSCEELQRLTLPGIAAHWRQRYVPERLTLVLAGAGIDLQCAAEIAERVFRGIPRCTMDNQDCTGAEQLAMCPEVFHERARVRKPFFHYAYRVSREDREVLPLLQMLVSGTNSWSSRTWHGGSWFLAQLKREGLAEACSADYRPAREAEVLHLLGRAADSAARDALERRLAKLGSAVAELAAPAAVDVVRRQLTADILRTCSSPAAFAELYGIAICTQFPTAEEMIRRIKEVSADFVREAAARLFHPKNCVAGWLLPDDTVN